MKLVRQLLAPDADINNTLLLRNAIIALSQLPMHHWVLVMAKNCGSSWMLFSM